MAAPDFSCIPCAGVVCFRKAVVDRTACAQKPHRCNKNEWECRCCEACTVYCGALDEALEKINGA